MKMKFIIRRKVFSLEEDEVTEKMRGIEPESGNGKQKYFVKIEDEEYPIKQVIAECLDLSKAEFTSMDAHRILTSLGFEVIDKSKGDKQKRENNRGCN
jgi:hypothetical protein